MYFEISIFIIIFVCGIRISILHHEVHIYPSTKNELTTENGYYASTTYPPSPTNVENNEPQSLAAILNYLQNKIMPELEGIQDLVFEISNRSLNILEHEDSPIKKQSVAPRFVEGTTANAAEKPKYSLSCDIDVPNGPTSFIINGHLFNNLNVFKRTFRIAENEDADYDESSIKTKVPGLYARFGMDNKSLEWKYFNEINETFETEILTLKELFVINHLLRDLSKIGNPAGMAITDLVEVESDLVLSAQTTQSRNPSYLTVRSLNDVDRFGTDVKICLDIEVKSDMTRMSLASNKKQMKCFGSPMGNSCGHCGLPSNNNLSGPIILKSVRMDPTGPGAYIPDDQWRRNQYIFRGSHYFVYIKIKDCPS